MSAVHKDEKSGYKVLVNINKGVLTWEKIPPQLNKYFNDKSLETEYWTDDLNKLPALPKKRFLEFQENLKKGQELINELKGVKKGKLRRLNSTA
tara:strand:+ start:75 stop:356 length:282 start_codon:yes stop_codon:yes gene_type:complete